VGLPPHKTSSAALCRALSAARSAYRQADASSIRAGTTRSHSVGERPTACVAFHLATPSRKYLFSKVSPLAAPGHDPQSKSKSLRAIKSQQFYNAKAGAILTLFGSVLTTLGLLTLGNRVLFIFRSRYLFAIGLDAVYCLCNSLGREFSGRVKLAISNKPTPRAADFNHIRLARPGPA